MKEFCSAVRAVVRNCFGVRYHGHIARRRQPQFCEALEQRCLLTVPHGALSFDFENTHAVTAIFTDQAGGLGNPVNVSPSLVKEDLFLERNVGTDTFVPWSQISLSYSGANPATFSFSGYGDPQSVRTEILPNGKLPGVHFEAGRAERQRRDGRRCTRRFLRPRRRRQPQPPRKPRRFQHLGRQLRSDRSYVQPGKLRLRSATGDLSMQSSGIDRVDLTWSPVSGATEYRVEASFDGISFDPIEAASYGSSVTNASFVRMEPGDRLYARIAAYDGAELLGRSTVAGATTHLAVPNTPGLVRATIVGDQVTITWAVADELEDYFILERQTDGQPFDHFVRVDARSEGFTEAVPDPSRTYGYRIKAGNYVGDSAYSPVSVAAPPSAPEGEPELGHQDILVSFFGADPGAADSDGNRWFLEEQIHRELLDAHGYIALGPNERPYRDFNGPNAFRDLLAAMDRAEPFGRITQAEVASTTIRLLGWSLGAVEAVYFSQQLTDTRGLAGSFFWQSGRSLDVEVPVESMVLLDPVIDGLAPLTMRYIRGPVRTNVQELNNFWQRRGGISTIRTYVLGTYNTQFPIEVQLDPPATYTSQIAGVELRGRRIPFQEGVVERQIRIDTDPDYVNQEEVHDYIRDPQRFDGVLLGRDVNHSTLVWYQGPEAVQLLAP